MQRLNVPLGESVYIDANALIYSMERIEPYRTLLDPIWRAQQNRDLKIHSSAILLVEALVKPVRDGNTDIEQQYRELFEAGSVRLHDITASMLEEALQIRARTRLSTVDAIHAATSSVLGCSLFITNDMDFRRVDDLPVVVLEDLLA